MNQRTTRCTSTPARLPVGTAGPALAHNGAQADVALRALAKHATGDSSPRSAPDDADRVISWLFSVIVYATQTQHWQLLDEATRAMYQWDAASDQPNRQTNIQDWLRTLSGTAASVVATVVRDQPDGAKLFHALARETDADTDIRTAVAVSRHGGRTSPGVSASPLRLQRQDPISGLPDALASKVLMLLYQQADRLGWCEMSAAAQSGLYSQWAADPAVGGILLPHFKSEHGVRTWIKDIAMRQFLMALEGEGPTAQYVPRVFRGIDEIATAACGADWTAEPESVAIKPNRFIATNGDRTRLVAWGGSREFRHLIWAAMHAAHELTEAPAVVVTSHRGAPITSGDRAKQETIAHRSGVHLVHLIRDLHPRPDRGQQR